ncbi:MAG: hypothetical protein VX672_01550 [Planctomycetota bacterium]|nr:hypothetical protein [Planctomycetota bacterium]
MAAVRTSSLLPVLTVAFVAGCGQSDTAAPVPPSAIRPAAPQSPVGPVGPVAGAANAGAAAAADGVDTSSWTVSTAADDPKQAEVGGLVFPKPPTWVWTTPRMRFRTLQYEVPGVGGGTGAAELVFSLFNGNDGGPTDMNIDRWVGQFRSPGGGPAEATTSVEDIGGLTGPRMETRGDYQAMGQPAPRPGQVQFGAIVEAPGRRVFVRLVGPEATVEAAREDFDRLIAGVMPAG